MGGVPLIVSVGLVIDKYRANDNKSWGTSCTRLGNSIVFLLWCTLIR